MKKEKEKLKINVLSIVIGVALTVFGFYLFAVHSWDVIDFTRGHDLDLFIVLGWAVAVGLPIGFGMIIFMLGIGHPLEKGEYSS
jgi:hypothetical protein